ncbi:hypothetical protein CXU06_11490 [Akkermansia muciniphila]|jgi:hypothetical protein|nr:hypothetical protein CXU06_11490 [Akkermansia muciniphila]
MGKNHMSKPLKVEPRRANVELIHKFRGKNALKPKALNSWSVKSILVPGNLTTFKSQGWRMSLLPMKSPVLTTGTGLVLP